MCLVDKNKSCLLNIHIYFTVRLILLNENILFTCGKCSNSISSTRMDGLGVVISWPVHISYSKWPKQMISTFSISVVERDHITALMRELKPSRPFSRPDNLGGNEISIWYVLQWNYKKKRLEGTKCVRCLA